MRIDELTKAVSPPKDLLNVRSVNQYLDDAGFSQIGSGGFALVYRKLRYPYVIKLFDKKDIGYLKFLKYCATHKNNPNLPVFRGLLKSPGDYYACRMEELTKPSFDLSDFFYVLRTEVHKELEAGQDPRATIEAGLKKHGIQDQNLIDTIYDLARTIQDDPSIRFDLHGANVMMRGSTVVIIDPFAPR